MSVIFPTNSPVDRLGGDKPENPVSLSPAEFRGIIKRLRPLLQAKEEADKVYSKGYFENHYPDADKEIKSLLHRKVMAAWSNSLTGKGSLDESTGLGLGGGITINLNLVEKNE